MWKAGLSLAQVFAVNSLDEDVLFALAVLLADSSCGEGEAAATREKALQEVRQCAGFSRVVDFLCSDPALRLQGPAPLKQLFLSG